MDKVEVKKWVYCPVCNHRLFVANMDSRAEVEIKCHSCKTISTVYISNGKIKAVKHDKA